jgi:predicted phosphodiesterase
LEWLTAHNAVSIRGNTDDKVVKLLKGKKFKKPGKAEKRIMYTHTAEVLTSANRSMLKNLTKKEKVIISGREIAMFHGSPEKHTEFLFPDTPNECFELLARNSSADIIITGHSHMPFHKIINSTHFINPGSVGRMFDGIPQASFAVLQLSKKKVQVNLARCAYDIEEVAAELSAAGLPDIYQEMYRRGRKLN